MSQPQVSFSKTFLLVLPFILSLSFSVSAQENAGQVELTGDRVEYSVGGNRVEARGNVVVENNDITLYADEVDMDRDTHVAHARGHVRLVSEGGEVTGDSLVFDFKTETGDFFQANIYAHPYYGKGRKISKVDENKYIMYDGYLTTSDYDKPEYRITSKRTEIYPSDKVIGRRVALKIGPVPVMYLPRYTQSLVDTQPKFIFTPGYDKEWGAFVLTQYRLLFNEHIRATLRLDYRERLDLAEGLDVEYRTKEYGEGSLSLYYSKERKITSKHLWEERPSPTTERERYKAEWRHKWDIDETTSAIAQFYKLSDRDFLKDYFENEYEEDVSPDTYFLLTKAFPKATLSLQTEARVNRFETKVERLPELRLDVSSLEVGDSNFYLTSYSMLSNLTQKFTSPTEVNENTLRFDTLNEISYPTKLGIFEVKPFVGMRNTYYSQTQAPEQYDSIRSIFRTGTTLSTKFFRIYEAYTDEFGLDIHRLRHIITPSASYLYTNVPTVTADQLDQYDAVDSITRQHFVNLALENKLQTKRNGVSVDLLRVILETDFFFKEQGKSGFKELRLDADVKPLDWLTLYFDASYDTKRDRLETANFDLYVNGGEKWYVGIGKRFNREVDDILTTEYFYRFNPKWALTIYQRYDLEEGRLEEQNYILTRDLHSWIWDMSIKNEIEGGTEFFMVFTLKAFPEIGFDFGSTLHRRERGRASQ